MNPSSDSRALITIAMVAVTSSQIEAIGYDEPSRTLQIDFKDNPERVYQYHEVPKPVFDAMVEQQAAGLVVQQT